jgi:putative ABC transport system permease protein
VIGLAWAMIRVRRAHAVTVWALATLAIAAAVAAPLYARAAERSVTAVDVAAATPDGLTIAAAATIHVRVEPDDPEHSTMLVDTDHARQFDRKTLAALTIPGFQTVFGVGVDVGAGAQPTDFTDRPDQVLQFLDGYCAHLVLVAGRCAAGPGEVVVGAGFAARQKLTVGGPMYVQSMTIVSPPSDPVDVWAPSGRVSTLTVVGVYRLADPSEVYWTGLVLRGGESLFVDRDTNTALDHPTERQTVLAYPGPRLATPDALITHRDEVSAGIERLSAAGSTPITAISKLFERIDADRRQVTATPDSSALPLIVLCCFVVFLAATSTAQARRVELGMLKLRGATAADRLWLASAEIVAPLVAGAIAGYLLGPVAVWLLARATLTVPTGFSLTAEVAPRAALALLATVVAGLIGLRRDLFTSAAELLRRVPASAGGWGGIVARTLAVVIAVLALIQVRASGNQPSTLSSLAPALVILAIALLLATLFDPVAAWWGRRALRRGVLGTALALLHLGRRRSGSRVVALLVVAVGLVGFAAAAYQTGTTARRDQVRVSVGASRVLLIRQLPMRTLLYATRKVDPQGAYAMAVVPLNRGSGTTAPTMLAVDSGRLSTAAFWPTGYGGQSVPDVDARGATALMRPRVAPSVEIAGSGLTLTATMDSPLPHPQVTVTAIAAPLDGAPPQWVRFAPLAKGTHEYHAPVACPVGCRLVTLSMTQVASGSGPAPVTVTFSRLSQTGPDADLVRATDFAAWVDKHGAVLTIEPERTGAAVTIGRTDEANAQIGPDDAPASLPAVAVPDSPAVFTVPVPHSEGADSLQPLRDTSVNCVVRTPVLPRVGSSPGALVDLDYLTRIAEPGLSMAGEVWLGPAAPADTAERLSQAGLIVVGERSFDRELAMARGRPNAIGLQFLIAVGILCLALGVGGLAVAANAERPARAQELRALRGQGLPARVVAQAGRRSYLLIVAVATLGGAVAATAAWFATRDRLSLVDVLVPGPRLPFLPGPGPVWVWGTATAALALAGVMLATVLSRAARTDATETRTSRTGGTRR